MQRLIEQVAQPAAGRHPRHVDVVGGVQPAEAHRGAQQVAGGGRTLGAGPGQHRLDVVRTQLEPLAPHPNQGLFGGRGLGQLGELTLGQPFLAQCRLPAEVHELVEAETGAASSAGAGVPGGAGGGAQGHSPPSNPPVGEQEGDAGRGQGRRAVTHQSQNGIGVERRGRGPALVQ